MVHKALGCSAVPFLNLWSSAVTAQECNSHDDAFTGNTSYDATVTLTGIVICPVLSSVVSRLKAVGGTLQAAGLGCTEITEMVSRPSEPRQAYYAEEVL